MLRPPESLKSFANHMGALAEGESAAELIRLLRLSGFLAGPAGNASPYGGLGHLTAENDRLAPPSDPNHLGIWERRVENGLVCFVRRPEMRDEWHLWANVGRIEARTDKTRVVLIGESVARGYLYDPEYTVAMALEMTLRPRFGEGEIEVIDLARTNLGYKVRDLAIGALQLQPDAVVIFAGNNWNVSEPRPAEVAETNQALAQDAVAGVKRACEAQTERNARRIINDIASAYQNQGVPLIWIIPEFNLADWRDPITNAPYLGRGMNRKWLVLLADAQQAMRDGNFSHARELAEQMIEIDQGLCSAGLYILAECCQQAADFDGARKYLERARDALTWDLSQVPVPRAQSVTQRALREEPQKYQNQVVDLPVLFKEYLNGALPDRRLFLDYCHLTSEGIRVAMGAAASCVLRALKGIDVPWPALAEDHIRPSREIEADANFLASIMNGHWIPSYDLVRHYCSQALKFSPHVAELMINYLELQTRSHVPKLLSGAEERISKLGSPVIHQYLLRLNEKRLDKVLLAAIVDALQEVGIDAHSRLEGLRREEHSVTQGETNLLAHYYNSAVNQPQELAWLSNYDDRRYRHDADYYKAYGPESRFVFVGEAGFPIRLSLTCRRTESATTNAPIVIEMNGHALGEITASHQWATWDVSVAGEVVRDGLNDIAVRWPIAEFPAAAALEKAALRLGQRAFPDFYPSFGEIHSFTASDGRTNAAIFPSVREQLAAAGVS